ncbi:hypothetical protein CBM2633_P30002 [Cupriavidus taiwanensis]|uniref:SWIM-type domain-containing protein n=2 Tax=Cupriavidus TaxID=106589 RepID=A0A375FDE5_9BURK|nr:hypothetical protein CBM2592_P30002 [Cupriavidus taiwanensis]SOZ40572.1 hypothetical protein CBM2605_P30002 [Cupriavidus neocaledonicus]SOY75408.1 hypothetical protein CBM2588_P30002 [Cupriavidus taiwanensis]SOY75739.1 hypothetical protein CBM2585_P30002 [Cupriavidus taiwanensis]SOY76261.1 hypothetical protein CBM2589_P30002 [Cupriavidus taiwanensis]
MPATRRSSGGCLIVKLDPAVLGLSQKEGINVFPTGWRDLRMTCSCPDWAVPCKHLAAVIYVLSAEIDRDPFLVFSLRGLDLVSALDDCRLSIQNEVNRPVPTLSDLLPMAAPVRRGEKREEQAQVTEFKPIDCSSIPDLLEPLSRLLPEHPSFSFPRGISGKRSAAVSLGSPRLPLRTWPARGMRTITRRFSPTTSHISAKAWCGHRHLVQR